MATRNVLGPTTTTTTTTSATLSLPSSADTTPDSYDDPQIPPPETFENPDPYDPELTREPKRRRSCLKALEKVEELLIAPHNSNPGFAFSFDTKSIASSPDITPKFGSFNFEVSGSEKQEEKQEEKKADVEDERQEENDHERIEINGSFEAVEETTNKED